MDYELVCWICFGLVLNAHQATLSQPTGHVFIPTARFVWSASQCSVEGIWTWSSKFLPGSKVTTHLHNSKLSKQQRAAVLRGRWVERLMENATLPTQDQEPAQLITSVFQVSNCDQHPNPSYNPNDSIWLLIHWRVYFILELVSTYSSPQHETCTDFTLSQ